MTALSDDPRYKFAEGDPGRAEIMAFIQERLKIIRAQLPRAFRTLVPGHLEVKRLPPEEEPGASASARMTLDMRSLAYFDDRRMAWVADAGEYEILVGASSDDIPLCASVTLTDEWVESARDAWRSSMI